MQFLFNCLTFQRLIQVFFFFFHSFQFLILIIPACPKRGDKDHSGCKHRSSQHLPLICVVTNTLRDLIKRSFRSFLDYCDIVSGHPAEEELFIVGLMYQGVSY